MKRGRLWVTLVAVLGGCGGDSVRDEGFAGTVVTGPPLEEWQLGDLSFPPIGVIDEPATHALDRPRFVRLDADGIIHVVHSLNQIRSFRTDGTFLGDIGREGDGPGEFRRIYGYRRLDDGQWIVLGMSPLSLRRLAADGTELERRTISVPIEAVNVRAAMTAEGQVVALESWFPPERSVDGPRARVVRDTVSLVAVTLDGTSDQIGEPLGGYPWLVLGDSWNGAPLGAIPSVSAARTIVAATDGHDYVVQVVDLSTGGHVSLRLEEEPPVASESNLERWYAARQAFYDQMGWRVSPPTREWRPELPPTLPAYAQVVVDEVGCIWARRYRVPPTEEFIWDVLDPGGRLLARLPAPANLEVYEIHEAMILGVLEDELGVGRITAFDLPAEARGRSCGVPAV